ncbi:MAG: glycosyl hydrolase family 32 [Pseudozobellia sp.]|nr:glycosyl hydrolase family 32 [Pseudozobellia sp.]|tara:strand:- start:93410 stop:95017 length:1608 start_codon:yes stop_codon:yes gene_type:complete
MNNRLTLLITVSAILFQTFSCKNQKEKPVQEETKEIASVEEQLYRPNFHFTPKIGWMNDPNGMFYLNGKYHLFYQHYPDDNIWGPMHWGHAISTDLIKWEHLTIALYPDELGYIFSGSAVVDYENTSGLAKNGETPIVAMYTYHDPKKGDEGKIDAQTQAIAYSLDEGKSWTKYDGNPVIENPGIRDYRDPKVTWDEERQQWAMILAADSEMMIYTSKNLIDWTLTDRFGKDVGSHDGVWECPDLFPMTIEGTDEVKWVMLGSISGGAPNGGNGTQYFIGNFDGEKFTLDDSFKTALAEKHDFWIDFGKDNYAGVTWSNVPKEDGRKIFIGWMVDGHYANQVPTTTWRSSQSVPRTLRLISENGVPMLRSEPVDEVRNFIDKSFEEETVSIIEGEEKILGGEDIDYSKARIAYTLSSIDEISYTFKLSNEKGEELLFGYNSDDKQFFVDRRKSGIVDFHDEFAEKISVAPRLSEKSVHDAEILLDKTSIELFFDGGSTPITEIFFPTAPYNQLSVISENGELILEDLKIDQLKFD